MNRIHYGGDYNPEQWPRPVWEEDSRLLDMAGMDLVTLGVFDWALLQRPDESYDFAVLDDVIAQVAADGRRICLATATGAVPPWLARRYPGVLRVDFEGRRHRYGQRHHHCPSSPDFARLSVELARRIAHRYGDHPAVIAWHAGNEYGGACYCELCELAFQDWLRQRYGTLERLNDAWYTRFWSHEFTDWAEIVVPSALSEHWNGPRHTAFQGITLDYRRFLSDALLANFTAERDAIRAAGATQPVTTNLMGLYEPLDYARWALEMDFVSWDNYPPDHLSQARMALTHDLMRGLKGGAPFWVMEQTPSMTACREVNPVKRPGTLGLWSHQSVAHGADTVAFFQLRQSRGACEKYHGAVIGHAGREDTRVFRECAALGAEMKLLGDVVGARTHARVALLMDWQSWWALEISDGPSRHFSYRDQLIEWYTPWWERGVAVDVVPVTADWEHCDLVLAPGLHMVSAALAERFETYVGAGGTMVSGVLSGLVDDDDLAHPMVGPGVLAPVMGIRIDETDALAPTEHRCVDFGPDMTGSSTEPGGGPCVEGRIVVDVIQPKGARTVAVFVEDFYAGCPAVTRHRFGAGEGWYVGTVLNEAGLAHLVELISHELGIAVREPDGVERAERCTNDARFVFWLNHAGMPRTVSVEAGVDLLTGREYADGDSLDLDVAGVAVLRS